MAFDWGSAYDAGLGNWSTIGVGSQASKGSKGMAGGMDPATMAVAAGSEILTSWMNNDSNERIAAANRRQAKQNAFNQQMGLFAGLAENQANNAWSTALSIGGQLMPGIYGRPITNYWDEVASKRKLNTEMPRMQAMSNEQDRIETERALGPQERSRLELAGKYGLRQAINMDAIADINRYGPHTTWSV